MAAVGRHAGNRDTALVFHIDRKRVVLSCNTGSDPFAVGPVSFCFIVGFPLLIPGERREGGGESDLGVPANSTARRHGYSKYQTWRFSVVALQTCRVPIFFVLIGCIWVMKCAWADLAPGPSVGRDLWKACEELDFTFVLFGLPGQGEGKRRPSPSLWLTVTVAPGCC